MMGHVGWHSYSGADESEPDPGVPALVDVSAEVFERYFVVRLRYELAKRIKRASMH